VVDHPQRSPGVVSVWLGRFEDPPASIYVITNESESPLSTTASPRILQAEPDLSGPIVLAIRFDSQKAYPSVSTISGSASDEVNAAGYPWTFSVRYWAGKASGLSALLDSVRVLWEPDACGFPIVHPE
jgi:hypothetical protein